MRGTHIAAVLALTLGLLLPAYGQIDRGSIKGLVVDATDALVPGASLELTSLATGVTQKTQTENTGSFIFVGLPAGQYRLTCEAAGFKKFVQAPVLVDVGRTISLRLALETGTITDSVTVQAEAGRLDTETSDVGTSVSRKELLNLPVPLTSDSRNPLSFVVLAPGVAGSVPGATPDMRLHVSGAPTGTAEVYIDGIPMADTDTTGNIGSNHPSIEAVGEFKLSNNGQSSEYGLAAGIVSFTFRSGTNQPHGSLYEFLQNDVLNAIDSPTKSIAARNGTEAVKAPLKQNEYGFSFGGPVWLPKLYNGRDKTFFFVNYTGFKYRPSSNSNSLTTLPDGLRDGNFSSILGGQVTVADGGQQYPLFDAAGRPILAGQIYYPASAHPVTGPDGHNYVVRDPVQGNIIPASDPRLSKVSKSIASMFPKATSSALFNNYSRVTRQTYDQGKLVLKFDHQLGARHALSGSYFRGENDFTNNGWLSDLSASGSHSPSRQYRFNETFTASPRVVNVLTAGFLRDKYINSPMVAAPALSSLGIQGIGQPDGAGWPAINVIGQDSIGGTPYNYVVQNRFVVTDTLNWSLGNHSLRFGAEVRRLQRNDIPNSGGGFDFRSPQSGISGTGFIHTANGPKAVSIPDGVTGHSVASLLFGAADYSRFDLGYTTEGYRWFTLGSFVQDDWKVRRDLTINLGLRYEYARPRSEVLGRIATMNPTLPNPAAGGLPGAIEFYGTGAGRNGRNRFGEVTSYAFQPRIGLAFAPGDQKTVFRTGFALTRLLGNDNLNNGIGGGLYAPGFNGVAQASRPSDAINSPAFYWDNPFPAFTAPPSINPGILTGGANPPYIAGNSGMMPTQVNWSFGIQRALPKDFTFETTYVGTHAYHLGLWRKPNQVHPSQLQNYKSAAAAAGMPVNEFFSLDINDPRVAAAGIRSPWPGFTQMFGAGATVGQALRPFPHYGNIDQMFDPIGSTSYNGLQTKLQKRFSQGLTMLLSYTFSKTIGDVDNTAGALAGAENAIWAASFQQNFFDERSERSVTSSDIPQVVALSYTYELPFGPGKPFFNRGGVAGKIVGGWEFSGIHLYQTGRPIHIENWAFGSANPLRAADGFSFRANIVPGQPLVNPNWDPKCNGPLQNTPGRSTCQFYINPAAFTAPPGGEFGNASKFLAQLRMRPYYNEDFSIRKRISITERVNFSVQANMFNAFNRVVWTSGGPPTFILPFAPRDLSNASLANSTTPFGILTSQQNGPRRIQLAARLEF